MLGSSFSVDISMFIFYVVLYSLNIVTYFWILLLLLIYYPLNRGIYNYISETKHASRVYNVAAIL
jgi:hypothetical protein